MNPFELVVFAALFGLAAAFHLYESRAWRSERRDLLNRVMARSYNEFVHSVTATTSEVPQMTSDEAEAKWHEMNKIKHPDQYPDEELA